MRYTRRECGMMMGQLSRKRQVGPSLRHLKYECKQINEGKLYGPADALQIVQLSVACFQAPSGGCST